MNLNKLRRKITGIQSVFGKLTSGLSRSVGGYDLAKSPDGDIFPGDIQIYGFKIFSNTPGVEPIDLLNLVYEINIYESIASPVIFGNATIRDSGNILQQYKFSSNEYISIEFGTPGLEKVKYIFDVMGVYGRTTAGNMQAEQYQIEFCSPIYTQNGKQAVSSIDFLNLKYNEIIKSICENNLGMELTTYDDVLPHFEHGQSKPASFTTFENLLPLQAIDKCRQLSVSPYTEYSPFLFFQNKDGLHFTTLAGLIKRVRNNFIDEENTFRYDRFAKKDFENITFNNIIAYNNIVNFSLSRMISSGGYASEITLEDSESGATVIVRLSDVVGFNQAQIFESMDDDPEPITSSQQSKDMAKINQTAPPFKMYKQMHGVSKDKMLDYGKKIVGSHAYMAYFLQHVTRIHIYGHSNITVGTAVKLLLPNTSDTENQKHEPVSGRTTGKYLVTKVRHRIVLSDRPGYTQALEVAKVGLNRALPVGK